MANPETTGLVRLTAGCWMPRAAVLSVVALGANEYFKSKPSVVLKTATDTLSWDFETIEKATAFADRIAELCNERE